MPVHAAEPVLAVAQMLGHVAELAPEAALVAALAPALAAVVVPAPVAAQVQ